MTSIYQEIILDHYKNPRNFGHITNASTSCSLSNPLCGDEIGMEADVEKGVVKSIVFNGQGCAISTASASLLTEYSRGKKVDQLKKLDTKFVLNMLGIELSPNRLKCALLPLEALHKLL